MASGPRGTRPLASERVKSFLGEPKKIRSIDLEVMGLHDCVVDRLSEELATEGSPTVICRHDSWTDWMSSLGRPLRHGFSAAPGHFLP